MRNYAIYTREVWPGPGFQVRKEVFKTHSDVPDPSWGPVTCIHPDVERLTDGDAMIHALRMVGYTQVGMK